MAFRTDGEHLAVGGRRVLGLDTRQAEEDLLDLDVRPAVGILDPGLEGIPAAGVRRSR